MENFEQKKLNINSINGGQKFTSGSQLTPDAMNGVVEGLNLIDKKFVQNGSSGQDAFIADNGVTNDNNVTDNRAIKIGNTQSIGVEFGALRFWNVINGNDYYLDVSPTTPDNAYKKAALGGTNAFRSINGDLVKGDTVQGGLVKGNVVQADNRVTNGNNVTDNRAIKIGNTQSVGVNFGALRFWEIINGNDRFLDVSPTTPDNTYKKAVLGGTNPFGLVKSDVMQTGDEKISIRKLWSGNTKELDLSNCGYKLLIANIYFQFDAGNYFVYNDLIFWNAGEAYSLDGSDYIRHYVTAPALGNGKYIDIGRSGNKLILRRDGAANDNCGFEALYGVLLN